MRELPPIARSKRLKPLAGADTGVPERE